MDNYKSLSDFCRHCGSYNLIERLEPDTSIHYKRVICSECQHFIRWMPKPKVPEISIVKLLQSENLEPWERKFLKTIVYSIPTKPESIVIEAIQAKINSVSSGLNTE